MDFILLLDLTKTNSSFCFKFIILTMNKNITQPEAFPTIVKQLQLNIQKALK
jgi:hypothetical protein